MLYEIINPSDPYTIEANSLDVAFVACVLLGRGQYAFNPLNGDKTQEIPLFMFGPAEFGGVDEWCSATLHMDAETTLRNVTQNKSAELADCLDSCLIGKQEARIKWESETKSIPDVTLLKLERHDKLRSSMNDIGGRAYQMAKNIRNRVSDPFIKAPQQIFSMGK